MKTRLLSHYLEIMLISAHTVRSYLHLRHNGREHTVWALLGVMLLVLIVSFGVMQTMEANEPACRQIGVQGANLKEIRFSLAGTSLFEVSTTGTSWCGCRHARFLTLPSAAWSLSLILPG
jgi:K+-transporting ATPase A subunit